MLRLQNCNQRAIYSIYKLLICIGSRDYSLCGKYRTIAFFRRSVWHQKRNISKWGVADESLRVEDLNEDTSSGSCVGLPHDVLDVLFNGLFGDLKRIGNFFVRPSFS